MPSPITPLVLPASSGSENSRRSSQSTTKASDQSKSSLGIPIADNRRTAALLFYENMQGNQKWRLQSGCYVEDRKAELVKALKYEHPAMYCILDMADDNWVSFFSEEELAELNEHAKAPIQYPELPVEMQEFLRNIPDTDDLETMYAYLETQQLTLATQSSLIWLKFALQSALLLFKSNYFPVNNQNEQDICSNVWSLIARTFDDSVLTCRTEKASIASQQCNNKKRRIAVDSVMDRQQNPYIPDMVILHNNREYGLVEAAKTNSGTKQLVEGGKKCPEMMSQMFDRLLEISPTEKREIKIYGCLLSRLECTPLELSCTFGYVKLYKRGKTIEHPESPPFFRPQMIELLAHFWRLRLAIENVFTVVVNGVRNQCSY